MTTSSKIYCFNIIWIYKLTKRLAIIKSISETNLFIKYHYHVSKMKRNLKCQIQSISLTVLWNILLSFENRTVSLCGNIIIIMFSILKKQLIMRINIESRIWYLCNILKTLLFNSMSELIDLLSCRTQHFLVFDLYLYSYYYQTLSISPINTISSIYSAIFRKIKMTC